MTITVAQVESLKLQLREMPLPEKSQQVLSKQAAIARRAADLVKLQQRGYSIDEIADILTAHGLAVTGKSLKTYLYRARSHEPGRGKQPAPRARRNAAVTTSGNGEETVATGVQALAETIDVAGSVNAPVNNAVDSKENTPVNFRGHDSDTVPAAQKKLPQTSIRASGFTPRPDTPDI